MLFHAKHTLLQISMQIWSKAVRKRKRKPNVNPVTHPLPLPISGYLLPLPERGIDDLFKSYMVIRECLRQRLYSDRYRTTYTVLKAVWIIYWEEVERTYCNFVLRCAYGKGNFQRWTNACTSMIKRSLNISSLYLSTLFFHLYVFSGGKLWLNTCTVCHV